MQEDIGNISFKLFEILTNKDSVTEASLDYGSAQIGRNNRKSMTKVQNIGIQKPPTSSKPNKKKLTSLSKGVMPNYGNKSRSRVGQEIKGADGPTFPFKSSSYSDLWSLKKQTKENQ